MIEEFHVASNTDDTSETLDCSHADHQCTPSSMMRHDFCKDRRTFTSFDFSRSKSEGLGVRDLHRGTAFLELLFAWSWPDAVSKTL